METARAIGEVVDLLGFRGRIGPKTPVFNPETGAFVTNIAATDAARCLGRTRDGKHVGILVNTPKVEGPNPKLLLVEASRVERIQ